MTSSAGVTRKEPPIPKKPKSTPISRPKPTNSASIATLIPNSAIVLARESVDQFLADRLFYRPVAHVEDHRLDEDEADQRRRLRPGRKPRQVDHRYSPARLHSCVRIMLFYSNQRTRSDLITVVEVQYKITALVRMAIPSKYPYN